MAELLKAAIDKGALCPDDYQNILREADKDGITDKHEETILKAMHELIVNKILVPVPTCDECSMNKK
ncbi:MAG TPA: hypothetical protein PKG60_05275 [Spirochaetota bacterium]|nr:hypothetical protein [Spirochaetota bacterium]HPS88222.1 hypothetical protein [Spirochaetota bacterium]